MMNVQVESVSTEQVAALLVGSTVERVERQSDVQARWLKLSSGQIVILVEGMNGDGGLKLAAVH